jgi:TnpA family transposase
LREHRYAALLAHACNLGYARMGQAARIDPQQLAWTTQWYLRPEALDAANARIVNAHHALPLAQHLGSGRFSSSDGTRRPVGVDSPDARAVSRYFGRGRGITFYVWTSDQHTHYATRVIRTTVRDATYVLDGILDNQTELPIAKHTTDTAGYSDLVFALFDLLGLQFAPRLAGLPERRLYRPGPTLDTPAGRLLAHPLNLDLIRDCWDELVRCAASLRHGTVTASLLISRLQAAGAKLPLTRALQEYGRLIKTRFVLGYLADETERRAIGRQLNKAESLHALHDWLFHGRHGTVRLHTLERQSTQAHCLHLVSNAVIYWNTIYTQLALDDLQHEPAGDELGGLTPTIFEHVNALGTYDFDTARPAGQLRPLRSTHAA